ncbi:putative protease with the C-terminal PDZ domain [Xenococcus sp. PCC 7305]|uniref:M61 family metallopeptidase n=1 Tax=Xenococcus sp. PCC 7305 TaxID=102125 RepID=UPI0002ABD315|nr:M61 family metallopeptidase [Xenococcus sp. PCC 7305]ELS02220.1 putative protease with the C-terminal PDZ domain [Xenococcus sp. PCC 7305]
MTESTAIKSPESTKINTNILYQVGMSQPTSHLFEVTLNLTNWQKDRLDLKMPVWTPGSYLVREYARHLQDFSAEDSSSQQYLSSKKLSKNHWQIDTKDSSDITINYRVYANDLTVRTNHLDATHGYFNPAALLMFIPGFTDKPITVKIVPTQADWQISTTLPSVPKATNTYLAQDFDTLVDTPFEIGTQKVWDFEVLGKPHQFVLWGQGNLNRQQIIQDTKKIIETEAELFGGLPYSKYMFLLHLSGSGYGGLEHKDCCTLNYPRLGFRDKDKYNRFMQLVAHEFFHLWNIKRIRPQALETFDYEQENYTSSLWFSEGTTSYYDILIPLRSGIYNRKKFLENLSKDLTRYLTIPGRNVQPLGESSFDAWIKLYRRDGYSDNNQISYYLKGQFVSLLLDLLIREQHHNQRSLDDVMRLMWERFGKDEIGFTPQQLQKTIEEIAEQDLSEFFHSYLETTVELPFDDYLKPFGLRVKPIQDKEPVPHLGLKVNTENNREVIKFVEANSPAELAGINLGDELLAIAGIKVKSGGLNEHLKNYQPGDRISVTIFHQDELITFPVKLTEPRAVRYEIVQCDNLSEQQKHNLAGWLG